MSQLLNIFVFSFFPSVRFQLAVTRRPRCLTLLIYDTRTSRFCRLSLHTRSVDQRRKTKQKLSPPDTQTYTHCTHCVLCLKNSFKYCVT